MEFLPKYIRQTETKEPGDIVRAREDWNRLFNLLIAQGDHNTNAILEISKDYATKQGMDLAINAKIVEIGAGDMPKSIYDTDEDGIVDKAKTVVDSAITTSKIVDGAVTRVKLGTELQALLTTLTNKATNVKMGKISNLTPASTESGATDTETTINNYAAYDIGFTPTAVFIFKFNKESKDTGSNYVKETEHLYLCTEYLRFFEYSDHDSYTNTSYGGIAFTNSPALHSEGAFEVFRIVSNGFRLHRYNAEYTNKSGNREDHDSTDFSESYYIAIG